MTEQPRTTAGRALGPKLRTAKSAAEMGAMIGDAILAIETEARDGYVSEDDCAHSQKVACDKARAAALDDIKVAIIERMHGGVWLGESQVLGIIDKLQEKK